MHHRRHATHHRNCHTSHSVNLMLNYAYAVLESQVRTITATKSQNSTISYAHLPTWASSVGIRPDELRARRWVG